MVTYHNPMTPSQGTLPIDKFFTVTNEGMYYWYLVGTDRNAVTFTAQVQPSTATTALNVIVPEMRISVTQGTILLND